MPCCSRLQVTYTASSASFNVVDKASGAIVSTPGAAFSLLFTDGNDNSISSGAIAVTGAQVEVTPFPY